LVGEKRGEEWVERKECLLVFLSEWVRGTPGKGENRATEGKKGALLYLMATESEVIVNPSKREGKVGG